jgi:hypothetical protein
MIEDTNLSRAWSRVFLEVLDHPGTTIAPLTLSITGFQSEGKSEEDPAVRAALDACLAAKGRADIETVAWTIFPQQLWRLAQHDRYRLFDLYTEAYPRYRALNPRLNARGLYFGRLIAFGNESRAFNQLEWIISAYRERSSVRKTMLQAAVFDPMQDHVRQAQLGFPCLQHVTFVPGDGQLCVNAFYATQQLFDKAYGNWLGLSRLGEFMAREMGLTFTRLNCFVGIEKLERITKGDVALRSVEKAARDCLSGIESQFGASGSK